MPPVRGRERVTGRREAVAQRPWIASGAAASLKEGIPKDAAAIEFALADGPREMRAVAIAQVLNLRLMLSIRMRYAATLEEQKTIE